MDSVSALVFDKVNREFVFVKQFRPALRFGASERTIKSTSPSEIGFCYELCAGLIDIESRSKEQTVVDEIREELGYEVSTDDLQYVNRNVGNVGMSGARGYMYYVEVTPEQKKYPGGGLESEGEQIESVHLKEEDIDSFLLDQSKEKSTGFFVAFYWWKHLRHQKLCVCTKKKQLSYK